MSRKPSPNLTEAELRLMEILWEKGRATVGEVVEASESAGRGPDLAYTTVLTVLRILEKKGYLRHEKEGRAFVYEPVVNRAEARAKAVRYVVSRFFDDSPELLMLNMLEREQVDHAELKRLKKLIEETGDDQP